IRSSRSGISPRCSIDSSFYSFSFRGLCGLQNAWWTRLQRTPFDQRIRPLAQRRNVNVNPVLVPVQRGSVIAELLALFGDESMRKLFDVFGHEVMLIEKNE